ncbi:MAG TPA: excinuclease ABC subunit UvrA, partial [Thermodesulfobacteriota bacterium]|nr:excinuclease ABC subunit UvrA [Thermodesulfobacteriota bacterium]
LGNKLYLDPELIVPNPELSIREGALDPWAKRNSVYFHQILDALSEHYTFDIYTPFKKLPDQIKHVLLYGSGEKKIKFYYEDEERRHFFFRPFEGVIPNLERRFKETNSDLIREEIEQYMNIHPCPVCEGSRLKPESLFVKLNGKSIYKVSSLSITQALYFFESLKLNSREKAIANPILKEVLARLKFMTDMGLDYLTLHRSSATLSGGEGQRIRLATQIGSGLMGVLYILDEPSIGLHQRDNNKLINNLKRLRDLGNTVLVVEHDENTIVAADQVIDMGPGAGVKGGEVVFSGTPQQLILCENSLTGQYLSGRLLIPVPKKRRCPDNRFLIIRGARENNLKDLEVRFPLGLLICVTGVSGSGKSTLIIDTLYRALAQKFYQSKERPGKFFEIEGLEHIDKVIDIDQSPIGRTPRSNPATYTGAFTFIRELFAATPEAKVRGYKPGRFSFNVKGGRCEACCGDGVIKIEMHFLPDVYVTCDECKGKRYNRDTLEVVYKGKSIAEVLDMTVVQALDFFFPIIRIKEKLQTLTEVGLGYITLGQSAPTLSGGEAQRIKLSRELSKRSTGRTLYLLDEPTTGLHFADVQNLLEVLNRLTDRGNTIIIIEHNLEVIKTADHVIDLGPEGGDKGGYLVACGTPEEIIQNQNSYTGHYLKSLLEKQVCKKISKGY